MSHTVDSHGYFISRQSKNRSLDNFTGSDLGAFIRYLVLVTALDDSQSIEESIVKTIWEDKDTDYVAHHELYKKLGLKGVSELTLD